MSDYGQGPTPRPWHPGDPLWGDPYGAYEPSPDDAQQHPQEHPQHYPQEYGQYPQQQPQWDTQSQATPAQPPAQAPEYGAWETTQTGSPTTSFPAAGEYGTPLADHPYDGSAYPGTYAHVGYAPQSGPEQTAEWQLPPQKPGPPDEPRPFDEPGPFDEPDAPETHPFFTDAPDLHGEYGDFDDAHGADRPGKKKKKKRRSGCAILCAFVVFAGAVAGGGYVGYRYYENHIAVVPDYVGDGTGSVTLTIPDGATLSQIGNILKQNGVVKSVDAFTAAAGSTGIQGGSYTLRQHMSAAAAVALMSSPSAQNALVIPEGRRATQVYAALDKYLGLASGTTANATKSFDLGLPPYANGNPEGFLFPSRYSISKSSKPADALAQMIRQAQTEFAADNLSAQAQAIGRTPYEIIIIASLIQAEAHQAQDFGKVSRVIYNRLQQQMALGLDSTINYAKGRSTLLTTTADTHYPSPYNTYLHKGLPPGPIDNPGHQAIEAALNPTPGNWLYFVTVKPGDTRFTDSAAVQQQNVVAFNQYQQEHNDQ
ncbi:MAG: endolytic transglycosylase MltG [Streptomycetaceae bacterium]|nr:endolytic transglycosylase MltG [Streptomycetaceae bacterium]